MYKAILTKGIRVETPNDLGVAAKLSLLVAKDAKANIRTAWALGVDGHGYFGFLTDNNQKALSVLKKDFPSAHEVDVLVISAKDKIGEMADITNKVCNAGINIETLQATYLDNKPVVILSTNDNQRALGLFS